MLAVFRRAPLLLMIFAAALAVALIPAPTATASSTDSSYFVSATNSARADHGLARLAVRSDLAGVAQRWAQHLADRNELAHNPNLASQVCCWQSLGENVGRGPSAEDIQRAFMGSAEHRDNILAADFTEIGVGTARGSDGRLYVSEVFRRPTGGTPAAPAPTTTRTTHTARSESRPALVRPLSSLQVLSRRLRTLHGHPAADPLHRAAAWRRTMDLLARS